MAKLKKNAVISGLSGQLDKDHYARHRRDGTTIISRKPDFSNRQFSEGQLEVQSNMKAAAAYAKVASKTNPIYAKLAKKRSKKKTQNAYNAALKDWFRAPVIGRIDWEEGSICIVASDDTMVTKVTVAIIGEDGNPLEQAEAQSTNGTVWNYQAIHCGQIQVEAWDLTGNVTCQEFTPTRDRDVWTH